MTYVFSAYRKNRKTYVPLLFIFYSFCHMCKNISSKLALKQLPVAVIEMSMCRAQDINGLNEIKICLL